MYFMKAVWEGGSGLILPRHARHAGSLSKLLERPKKQVSFGLEYEGFDI